MDFSPIEPLGKLQGSSLHWKTILTKAPSTFTDIQNMSRQTNSRDTDSSSWRERPTSNSAIPGQSLDGLAWYFQRLGEMQHTEGGQPTAHEVRPVVDSIIDEQPGMTATASAPPASDMFPYSRTYMSTTSSTQLPSFQRLFSGSSTSNQFSSMNEPNRVTSTVDTNASHLENSQIIFHFPSQGIERGNNVTLTIYLPSSNSPTSTDLTQWRTYFNHDVVWTGDDGRSGRGIENAVVTQVAPIGGEHHARVMERVWSTLMEEFNARNI